jgi:hypothetical protein
MKALLAAAALALSWSTGASATSVPIAPDQVLYPASTPGLDGAYDDHFGSAVASDGVRLAIVAPGDSISSTSTGSVYVYTRSGASWVFEQKLVMPAGSQTGIRSRAAISGDWLFVVAVVNYPFLDYCTPFAFERSGGVWVARGPIDSAHDFCPDDRTTDIAASGDWVVFGNASGGLNGVLHLYHRDGAGFSPAGSLAPGDTNSAGLGYSVAIDGTRIAALAAYRATPDPMHDGSVFVYNLAGNWQFETELSAPGSSLGYGGIALKGDLIAAGAHAGGASAVVFERGAGGWGAAHALSTANTLVAAPATSVALRGRDVIVGSMAEDHGGAQVFTASGNTWVLGPALTPGLGYEYTQVGRRVAWAGDSAIVAAATTYFGDNGGQGAVYATDVPPGAVAAGATQRIDSGDGVSDDGYARAIAAAGGLLLVGQPYRDPNESGAVTIYRDVAGTWTLVRTMAAANAAAYDRFGEAITFNGSLAAISTRSGTEIYTRSGDDLVYLTRVGTTGARPAAMDAQHLVISTPSVNLQGDAYIYALAGNSLTLEQRVESAMPVAYAEFGTAAALSGSHLVVSDDNRTIRAFERDGLGHWNDLGLIGVPDPVLDDGFRPALAIDGDELAIRIRPKSLTPGAIGVFAYQPGSGWTANARLTAQDSYDVGSALRLSNGLLLAGNPAAGPDGAYQCGALYAYGRTNGSWHALGGYDGGKLNAQQFGAPIVIAGGRMLIGAVGDASPAPYGAIGDGAVYVAPLPEVPLFLDSFE